MHLFRFNIDQARWDINSQFNVNYYGVGFDPTMYDDNNQSGHSRVRAVIWNPSIGQSGDWEVLGDSEATVDDTRDEQLIHARLNPISAYMDGDGFVQIAATATNTGPDFPNDVDHDLRTYFVELNNDQISQVHRGNSVDVYCHDPKNYKETVVTHTLSGSIEDSINISGFPGFLHEVVEIRESVSGTVLDPDSYTVSLDEKALAFSNNANYKFYFDDTNIGGTRIDIVCRF
jgi:hypothetical protein